MTGIYEAYALCAGTRTVDWSTRMYLHPIGENRDLRLFHVGAQGAGRADRRRYRVHPPARPCQGASVAGFRTREELLHAAGLDATRVANVILTHLHSDHFDVEGIFPGAVFWVQRTELDFWRVCCARERWHQRFVSDCFAEDLARCSPAAGCGSSTELEDVVDGVSLELVGGHSPGMQIVVVRSQRGLFVIANDALTTYRNLRDWFPPAVQVGDLRRCVDAMARIRILSNGDESRICPRHDGEILKRFPEVKPGVHRLV